MTKNNYKEEPFMRGGFLRMYREKSSLGIERKHRCPTTHHNDINRKKYIAELSYVGISKGV